MLSKVKLTSSFISSAKGLRFFGQVRLRQRHVTSTSWSLHQIPNQSSTSFRRPTVCKATAYANGKSHVGSRWPRNLSEIMSVEVSSISLHPCGRAYFHSSSSTSSTSESYAFESVTYPTSWASFSDIEIDFIEVPPSKDRVDVTWGEKAVEPSASSSSSSLSLPLTTSFPLIWLRDNCRCPQCFSADAKSRIVNFKGLDNRCNLDKVSVTDDSKSMSINWSDGHVSHYPARWLRCNVFDDSEPDPLDDIPPQLWDAPTCRDRLRSFDFNDLLTDDRALYEMLLELKVLGISVIENSPQKLRQLHRLAERVGYLVPTNYGETFQAQSRADPSNMAFTSGEFPNHTDLSYASNPPGILMLHCIKQTDSEGGSNTLIDGFKIAHDLRKTSPDLYDVLTKQVIEFYDTGTDKVGEIYQKNSSHIIRLDHKNEVDRILFSDHARSSMSRMPVDDVIMTYKAISSFVDLLNDPQNVFEYKMKDGDILIMNNYRTVHGRKAFTMQPGSSRHLEVGYFEWDSVMSKLRILGRKLKIV